MSGSNSDPPKAPEPTGRVVAALVLDACCVLVFVIIGRASHREGETVLGLARTAWPFVAGAAAGWLAGRVWRRPTAVVAGGGWVWLLTVALGMILRVVSGQGTAVTFVLVALGFLGLVMLGWRCVARLAAASVARRSAA